jgi:hypothetical protein
MSAVAPYYRRRPDGRMSEGLNSTYLRLKDNNTRERELYKDDTSPICRSTLAWQVERPTVFANKAFRRPGRIEPIMFGTRDGSPQWHRQPVRTSFQSPSPLCTPDSWKYVNSSPRYATTASSLSETNDLSLSLSPRRARHFMGVEPGKGSPVPLSIREFLE